MRLDISTNGRGDNALVLEPETAAEVYQLEMLATDCKRCNVVRNEVRQWNIVRLNISLTKNETTVPRTSDA
jgi:hypothetical protein